MEWIPVKGAKLPQNGCLGAKIVNGKLKYTYIKLIYFHLEADGAYVPLTHEKEPVDVTHYFDPATLKIPSEQNIVPNSSDK